MIPLDMTGSRWRSDTQTASEEHALPEWEKPISPSELCKARLFIGGLIGGLYVLACALPAGPAGSESGIALLLCGWMGIMVGFIAWYGNLLFFPALGLFLAGRFATSRWMSLVALALASQTFFWNRSAPFSWGMGFYAWFGSILALAMSACVFPLIKTTEQAEPEKTCLVKADYQDSIKSGSSD